jgi:hypothetical protein
VGHAKVKTRLPQSSRRRQDDTGPKQHTEKPEDFAGDYGDYSLVTMGDQDYTSPFAAAP